MSASDNSDNKQIQRRQTLLEMIAAGNVPATELRIDPVPFSASSMPENVPLRATLDLLQLPLFALKRASKDEASIEMVDRQGDGVRIQITPMAGRTRASMYDKEMLLWLVSLYNARLKENLSRAPSRTVEFEFAEFLRATGRGASNSAWERGIQMLERLKGTQWTCFKVRGGEEERHARSLSFIQDYELAAKDPATGQRVGMRVTLAEAFYQTLIDQRQHLAVTQEYYELPPLQRRFLEICRKFVGRSRRPVLFREEKFGMYMGLEAPKSRYRSRLREMVSQLVQEGDIAGFMLAHDPSRKMCAIARSDEPSDSEDVEVDGNANSTAQAAS